MPELASFIKRYRHLRLAQWLLEGGEIGQELRAVHDGRWEQTIRMVNTSRQMQASTRPVGREGDDSPF